MGPSRCTRGPSFLPTLATECVKRKGANILQPRAPVLRTFLRHAIELRSEFFHCCIFAGNFTSLSTVQSYLCGDRSTENSLINIANRPRHEASQPTDPGRGMNVAYNDAGAKNGEAG
jgi:hypothetical protein